MRYLVPHGDGFLHPRCKKEFRKKQEDARAPAMPVIEIFRKAFSLCREARRPLFAIAMVYLSISYISLLLMGGNATLSWFYLGMNVLLWSILPPGYLVAIDAAERNQPIDLARSVRAIQKYSIISITANLVYLFAVVLGFFLLFLPSFYILVRWGLAPVFITFKSAGPIKALESSWRATRGRFWKLFLPLCLPGLGLSALSQGLDQITRSLPSGSAFPGLLLAFINPVFYAAYGVFTAAVIYIVYRQEIKRMDARS